MSDNEKITFVLPKELANQLRFASRHLCGPPQFVSMNGIVTSAVQKELHTMQKKFNKNKPFSPIERK